MRIRDEDNPFSIQAANGWSPPKPREPVADPDVVKYAGLLVSRLAEVIAGSTSDEPFDYAKTATSAFAVARRLHNSAKSGLPKRKLRLELAQAQAVVARLDELAIAQDDETLEAFGECESFLAELERLLCGSAEVEEEPSAEHRPDAR